MIVIGLSHTQRTQGNVEPIRLYPGKFMHGVTVVTETLPRDIGYISSMGYGMLGVDEPES